MQHGPWGRTECPSFIFNAKLRLNVDKEDPKNPLEYSMFFVTPETAKLINRKNCNAKPEVLLKGRRAQGKAAYTEPLCNISRSTR
jgi:hypothetical protein